jgi:RNA polymerase subunit RPABC4/transcription elongation factor Spt4
MVEDRKCPNCVRTIPVDARICPYCKKELDEARPREQRVCPGCGRSIPMDARVCPYCKKDFEEHQLKEEKKHTGFGAASLILGIIGMCFIWTALLGVAGIAFWLLMLVPIGAVSIIFGAIGYWRKKFHDNYGLIGAILGILIEILGFIFMIISALMATGRI